jgi:hypothetical protein
LVKFIASFTTLLARFAITNCCRTLKGINYCVFLAACIIILISVNKVMNIEERSRFEKFDLVSSLYTTLQRHHKTKIAALLFSMHCTHSRPYVVSQLSFEITQVSLYESKVDPKKQNQVE